MAKTQLTALVAHRADRADLLDFIMSPFNLVYAYVCVCVHRTAGVNNGAINGRPN